jgi:Protein of unknown function (DUF3887)
MKKTIFLLSIFLLVGLVACGNNDTSLMEEYVPKAEEVVKLLNDGSYEEVYHQFDETMKNALPVEQMGQLKTVIEKSGEFETFDKSTVEEQDGFYVVVLIAKYSNEDRVYTISFNDQDEIAGLYVR